MPIIYEPKGKALEYSELAANLYKGCSHGCKYCYVPGIPPWKFKKNAREEFYSNPAPRPNVLKQLQRDAKKLDGDKRPVLFSFTSDCYQPIEKECRITMQAIETLRQYNIRPQVLTKAGTWAIERDGKILKAAGGIWAATLTTDNPDTSLDWEPGAPLPGERIKALKIAKSFGLETWVSFEPVIDPEAVFRMIKETHSFVDLFKVGKINYHPLEKEINWQEFLIKVESVLDKYSCKKYIKKDLLAFKNTSKINSTA